MDSENWVFKRKIDGKFKVKRAMIRPMCGVKLMDRKSTEELMHI